MKTKDKGGRPGHAPDDRSRQMVEVLSGFGIPQDKIADVIGVDGKTLRSEPRRDFRRLQLLREWSHDEADEQQVFT